MNRILLSGEITEESISDLIRRIYMIEREAAFKNIELYISSGGGEVDAARMLRDYFSISRLKLITIAMGKVASTAATIFMMGEERIMLPNSYMLLHLSSGMTNKSLTMLDLHNMYENSKKTYHFFFEDLLDKSKIDEEYLLEKIRNGDWRIFPEEAYELAITTRKNMN